LISLRESEDLVKKLLTEEMVKESLEETPENVKRITGFLGYGEIYKFEKYYEYHKYVCLLHWFMSKDDIIAETLNLEIFLYSDGI